MSRATVVVLTAIALAGAAAGQAHAQPEVHTLRGEAVIYNLAGTIVAEPARGDLLVVEVERRGRDADRLGIETDLADHRSVVRVIFPGSRIIYPELGRSTTNLRVAPDGTFFGSGEADGGLFPALRSLTGSGQVTISGRGSGLEAWADVRVLVPEGRAVSLNLAAGSVRVENVAGEIAVRTASGRVAVDGVRGPLDVTASSGTVTAAHIDGDASVRASSGRVTLQHARGGRHVAGASSGSVTLEDVDGDEVRATASSGSITLRRVQASQLDVSTSSGTITAEGVEAGRVSFSASSGSIRGGTVAAQEIRARASSGSVQLAVTADLRDLHANTSSGSVRLTVPETLAADLDIRTGSGGIRVDVPVTDLTSARSRFTGRMGEGGAAVTIRTSSGGVRVAGS